MLKSIEYFEVGDSFDAEGKGPYKVIANFNSEEVANDYAKDKGNYGKEAMVIPRSLIIVDSISEMESYKVEGERQTALKKLTPREREILGLNKEK